MSGTLPLAQIAEIGMFTDGVSRLVDWYGYTWPAVFTALRTDGVASLITRVRAAERERRPHERQEA